ncbi:MAG: AAA family ATPase [Anaerolineales bacterium]|jgi:thymidine kinase
MARIFPSSPAGALPAEVLTVFRFLRTLPDDYTIWHHLAPWQKDAPDFLILDPQFKALLVKISSAAPKEIRPIAQLLLIEDDRPALGEPETRVINQFLAQMRSSEPPPLGKWQISTAVLFPNIPEKSLWEARPTSNDLRPVWLSQEAIKTDGLNRWTACFQGSALDEDAMIQLRSCFTPEVVIPPELTTRLPMRRPLDAGLTKYLLDYDQEEALKSDLDLQPEGEVIARDFRLSLVNGVAGSGKTLLLLYRLRLLYSFYPNKRFLVLTHNRPLNKDMQARFYRLTGSLPKGIEWHTFNSWCHKHWPEVPAWQKPIGEGKRNALVRSAWEQTLEGSHVSALMLRSEIDWAKDQIEFSRDAYLKADRRGRGFRLANRERMWDAIEYFQNSLEGKHWLDWADVPRRTWGFIQNGSVKIEPYDVVLVDEAQFFAPLWFEVVRQLVKPGVGHLFLAADPTQGFLRRGESWKSLGFEVRGRSDRLRRSYRTTLEILNFATLFYRSRIPKDADDEDILAPDLFSLPNGPFPLLIPLSSSQDEIARLANEVAALAKQGVPLRDLLVLHAGWQGVKALIAAIRARLGPNAAWDPKMQYPGDYVRVTTLNAGTGLEAPIVFLAGLHELFEREHSLRLSDAEREALILENTRKIYMAATRAGQRLVFTYVGKLPKDLKQRFNMKL